MEKALALWARESPTVSTIRASQWVLAEETRRETEQQFLLGDILHRLGIAMDEVAMPHKPEDRGLIFDIECGSWPSDFPDSRGKHQVIRLTVKIYVTEHLPHVGLADIAVGEFRLV